MLWSPSGAHLTLQVRAAMVNGNLRQRLRRKPDFLYRLSTDLSANPAFAQSRIKPRVFTAVLYVVRVIFESLMRGLPMRAGWNNTADVSVQARKEPIVCPCSTDRDCRTVPGCQRLCRLGRR